MDEEKELKLEPTSDVRKLSDTSPFPADDLDLNDFNSFVTETRCPEILKEKVIDLSSRVTILLNSLETCYKVTSDIKQLGIINNENYERLLRSLPAGFMSKLILIPGPELSSKVNHLHFLLKNAFGNRKILIGIESICFFPTMRKRDFDLLFRVGDKIIAEDITQDEEKVIQKQNLMSEVASDLLHSEPQFKLQFKRSEGKSLLFHAKPIVNEVSLDSKPAAEFSPTFDFIEFLLKSPIKSQIMAELIDIKNQTDQAFVNLSASPVNNDVIVDNKEFDFLDRKTTTRAELVKLDAAIMSSKSQDSLVSQLKTSLSSMRSNSEIKPMFDICAAAVRTSRDLSELLENLSVDPVIRCVFLILKNSSSPNDYVSIKRDWSTTTEFKEKGLNVQKDDISEDLFAIGAKIDDKHVRAHFSFSILDNAFVRSIKSRAGIVSFSDKIQDSMVTTKCLLREVESDSDYCMLKVPVVSDACYIGKASKILNNSNAPPASVAYEASSSCDAAIASISPLCGFQTLEHLYSESRSVKHSTVVRMKGPDYFIGENEPFESVSLVSMNATTSSFKKTYVKTVFKPAVSTLPHSDKMTLNKGIVSVKFRTISVNDIVWYIKAVSSVIPYMQFALEHKTQSFSEPEVTDQFACFFFPIATAICNRLSLDMILDSVRHLFLSTTGHYSAPAEIVKKWKKSFIRHPLEFEMALRVAKMSILNRKLNMNRDPALLDASKLAYGVVSPFEDKLHGDMRFLIPTWFASRESIRESTEFELPLARCTLTLLEEKDLFDSIFKKSCSRILGMPASLVILRDSQKILKYLKTRSEYLVNWNISVSDQQRFSHSVLYVLAASFIYGQSLSSSDLIASFRSSCKSPTETFTNKASMSGDEPTFKDQASSSFQTTLEGILRRSHLETSFSGQNSDKTFSVDSDKLSRNMPCDSVTYLLLDALEKRAFSYRIFYKVQQVSDRDLAVLNDMMRKVIVSETIARELGKKDHKSTMLEKNDEARFHNLLLEAKKTSQTGTIYITKDMTRWGPNQLMTTFAAAAAGIFFSEVGLYLLQALIFKKMSMKNAKFPEPLVRLFSKLKWDQEKFKGVLKDCLIKMKSYMDHGYVSFIQKPSMCEGIFQNWSDLLHAILAETVNAVVALLIECFTNSQTCSDDEVTYVNPQKHEDGTEARVLKVHLLVSSMFNAIINMSKTFAHRHMCESKTIFAFETEIIPLYLRSNITAANWPMNLDIIEDLATSLTASNSGLRNGSPYTQALMVQALGLTYWCEAWRKWKLFDQVKDNPVHFGGVPEIEPLTTFLYGPLAHIACHDARKKWFSISELSNLYIRAINSEILELKQEDFIRSQERPEATVFSATSLSGVTQFLLPPRRLIGISKRLHPKDWVIPESDFCFDRTFPSVGNCLISLKELLSHKEFFSEAYDLMSVLDEFAFGLNKKIFKVNKSSMFIDPEAFQGNFSLKDFEEKCIAIKSEGFNSLDIKLAKMKAMIESRRSAYSSKINERIFNAALKLSSALHVVQVDKLIREPKASSPVIVSVQNSVSPPKDSSIFSVMNAVKKVTDYSMFFFSAVPELFDVDYVSDQLSVDADSGVSSLYSFASLIYQSREKYSVIRPRTLIPGAKVPSVISPSQFFNLYFKANFSSSFGIQLSEKVALAQLPEDRSMMGSDYRMMVDKSNSLLENDVSLYLKEFKFKPSVVSFCPGGSTVNSLRGDPTRFANEATTISCVGYSKSAVIPEIQIAAQHNSNFSCFGAIASGRFFSLVSRQKTKTSSGYIRFWPSSVINLKCSNINCEAVLLTKYSLDHSHFDHVVMVSCRQPMNTCKVAVESWDSNKKWLNFVVSSLNSGLQHASNGSDTLSYCFINPKTKFRASRSEDPTIMLLSFLNSELPFKSIHRLSWKTDNTGIEVASAVLHDSKMLAGQISEQLGDVEILRFCFSMGMPVDKFHFLRVLEDLNLSTLPHSDPDVVLFFLLSSLSSLSAEEVSIVASIVSSNCCMPARPELTRSILTGAHYAIAQDVDPILEASKVVEEVNKPDAGFAFSMDDSKDDEEEDYEQEVDLVDEDAEPFIPDTKESVIHDSFSSLVAVREKLKSLVELKTIEEKLKKSQVGYTNLRGYIRRNGVDPNFIFSFRLGMHLIPVAILDLSVNPEEKLIRLSALVSDDHADLYRD